MIRALRLSLLFTLGRPEIDYFTMKAPGECFSDPLRDVSGGYGFDSRTFDSELIGNILIFDIKMEHEFPELIGYSHCKFSFC